jgi:hypothetical protein
MCAQDAHIPTSPLLGEVNRHCLDIIGTGAKAEQKAAGLAQDVIKA